MEVKNITEMKLKQLNNLFIPKEIFNTEAELFIFDKKEKWAKEHYAFKKFFIENGEVFSNKLYTLHQLIDKKEQIGIEELVMPDKLISVDGKVRGFTMPYIENINLHTILNSKEFDVKEKIGYLKEIGKILEDIKHVREYKGVDTFYLNDIHEGNFILNKKTGKINVVDIDSARISNSLTQPSKYLARAKENLAKVSKYHQCENEVGASFIADENTDLFCYIVMILNFLYGGNVLKLSLAEFYVYLDYLSKLGMSKELLDKL